MAAVYNLEPPPTAKCIVHTTSGDLTLSLFTKQAPLACRSFLQHLLDGYYTSTTFHRLIPGFIIQGGDPTGTGQGSESAFPSGAVFKGGKDGRQEEIFEEGGCFGTEVHSRLKFNRRGLLGMRSRENGGQFFLTLGEGRELGDGQNTLFGRVEGDTIFNLVRMGEAELEAEGSERPLYPTRITGAEVLVNPFEGMVRREGRGAVATISTDTVGKKGVKKGKKNKTLLSFGGEDGEDGEDMVDLKKEKFNARLVRDHEGVATESTARNINGSSKSKLEKAEKARKKQKSRSPSPPRIIQPDKEAQLPIPNDEEASRSTSASPEPEPVRSMTSALDKTNAQIAALKASMKRNVQRAPVMESKKSALEQMIPETAMRGRKRKHATKDEEATMSFLDAFRTKLENAAPASKVVTTEPHQREDKYNIPAESEENKQRLESDNDEDTEVCDLHFISNCQSCKSWDRDGQGDVDDKDEGDQGWMSHALSFEKDRLGKDLNWKRKNEEELVVIDPREKTKDLREEARAKKLARMGKGGHEPEWAKQREPRKAA